MALTSPGKSWGRWGVRDKKVLVDTSAWIVSFRRDGPQGLKSFLRKALERDRVVTTPLIVLELLQGCKTQGGFDNLKIRLESLEGGSLGDFIVSYHSSTGWVVKDNK